MKTVKDYLTLVLAAVVFVLMSNTAMAQTYRGVHKVKDGMNQLVDVTLIVSDKGSPKTFDEIIETRLEKLKSEGKELTKEECIASLCHITSFRTKIFYVKNKATWKPTELFFYYNEETGLFHGMMKGFASNSYGVPGEISDMVTMDLEGSTDRM